MQIYFETYGCTLNKGEAEKVKDIVLKNNHTLVENIHNSDIILIFTCTVIQTTERKILRRLKEISKFNKKGINFSKYDIEVLGAGKVEEVFKALFK